MKKLRFTSFIIIAIALTACTFETSDNGDLDGYWQLTAVDTLATGKTTDMHNSGLFWAFQMKLLEVRNLKQRDNVFFRFNQTPTELTISKPVWDLREESDQAVTDSQELHEFGLNQLEETFSILQLSNQTMILQNKTVQMHFRKY